MSELYMYVWYVIIKHQSISHVVKGTNDVIVTPATRNDGEGIMFVGCPVRWFVRPFIRIDIVITTSHERLEQFWQKWQGIFTSPYTVNLQSAAALFSRFYNHKIQTWAINAASYLARWILRSRMQYAIEIGCSCNCQDLQGSVETHLKWGAESLWRVCT